MKASSLLKTAALCGAGYLLAVAPSKPFKPFPCKFYAHRGLHGNGVPENSLTAFRLAAESGFGSELDVNLDADGNVMVMHDDNLKRMTGLDCGINNAPASVIQDLRLGGSDEPVPFFSQVLELVNGSPLIVELKTTPRYAELCRKTVQLLRKYRANAVIESFDPRIVAWFRFNAPDIIRGQLLVTYNATNMPNAVKRVLLNTQLCNAAARPHFISFDKEMLCSRTVSLLSSLGAARMIWTATTPEECEAFSLVNEAVEFEGCIPEIRQ